ncbi:MAG TPA: flagellar biosynthesis protein FlhF [Bacilli bacterium]
MRVKRYVVDSMPEALKKIRSDLGNDAIILNTKELRSGGFLGLFAKRRIEVIAAMDNTSPAQKPHTMHTGMQATAVLEPVTTLTANPAAEAKQTGGLPGYARETEPDRSVSSAKDEQMLLELRQMKELVNKLAAAGIYDSSGYPAALLKMEAHLKAHDFNPLLIQSIMQKVIGDAGAISPTMTEAEANKLFRNQLLALLRKNGKQPIADDTKVVRFVGQTGVGKTTTIAKLAAEQVLKQKRSVGLITSDTYRIAAVEQLRTYANILNIPLEVVMSPPEMQKAFQRLERCDIIFVDTAGRNYRNEMYVSELNSLLKTKEKTETYLVVSLTAKYKDIRKVVENFSRFDLNKLLFTKMDETESYGAIFNLVSEFPLQLSYITNGQNVPDDIFQVNEEQLVDMILGGDGK